MITTECCHGGRLYKGMAKPHKPKHSIFLVGQQTSRLHTIQQHLCYNDEDEDCSFTFCLDSSGESCGIEL